MRDFKNAGLKDKPRVKKSDITRALEELKNCKDWGTQVVKGNYTVTMRLEGKDMLCSFYYKKQYIGDWYSKQKTIRLENPQFQTALMKGIRGAGFIVTHVS